MVIFTKCTRVSIAVPAQNNKMHKLIYFSSSWWDPDVQVDPANEVQRPGNSPQFDWLGAPLDSNIFDTIILWPLNIFDKMFSFFFILFARLVGLCMSIFPWKWCQLGRSTVDGFLFISSSTKGLYLILSFSALHYIGYL